MNTWIFHLFFPLVTLTTFSTDISLLFPRFNIEFNYWRQFQRFHRSDRLLFSSWQLWRSTFSCRTQRLQLHNHSYYSVFPILEFRFHHWTVGVFPIQLWSTSRIELCCVWQEECGPQYYELWFLRIYQRYDHCLFANLAIIFDLMSKEIFRIIVGTQWKIYI